MALNHSKIKLQYKSYAEYYIHNVKPSVDWVIGVTADLIDGVIYIIYIYWDKQYNIYIYIPSTMT